MTCGNGGTTTQFCVEFKTFLQQNKALRQLISSLQAMHFYRELKFDKITLTKARLCLLFTRRCQLLRSLGGTVG
jgi:hypothetical protein